MINFLFSVLAMPLRFLAWLVSVLRIYNPLPFLWAAWQLARDSQDAAAVVSLTAGSQGVSAAQRSRNKCSKHTRIARFLRQWLGLKFQKTQISMPRRTGAKWQSRAF